MDNKRITALFRHLLELAKKHTTGGLKRRLNSVESSLRSKQGTFRNFTKKNSICLHSSQIAELDFSKCLFNSQKKFNYFTTFNRFSLALNREKSVKSYFHNEGSY